MTKQLSTYIHTYIPSISSAFCPLGAWHGWVVGELGWASPLPLPTQQNHAALQLSNQSQQWAWGRQASQAWRGVPSEST